ADAGGVEGDTQGVPAGAGNAYPAGRLLTPGGRLALPPQMGNLPEELVERAVRFGRPRQENTQPADGLVALLLQASFPPGVPVAGKVMPVARPRLQEGHSSAAGRQRQRFEADGQRGGAAAGDGGAATAAAGAETAGEPRVQAVRPC